MVKEMRLTVVVENSASLEKPYLLAKHGLCFLIEVKIDESRETLIMMDTGPSSDVTLHNIKALGVDLENIEAIVLSHGHYDHVGGLLDVLKQINSQTLVVAHPKILNPKFTYKPNLKHIGPPFKLHDVESAGGLPLLARNSVMLAKGVMTTGEIERSVDFEKTEDFRTVDEGIFKEDAMLDEQSLIFDLEGKGLVVISGCGHSGIINTIRHAQRTAGENNLYAVIGGFHLIKASDERIRKTIDELLKFNLKLIGSCHCTGSKAVQQLNNAFGEHYISLRTGDVLRL
ncbi:MAG: MBL fold metallo-hydrolase [Candidatus Bathyarchaeia archaeon]